MKRNISFDLNGDTSGEEWREINYHHRYGTIGIEYFKVDVIHSLSVIKTKDTRNNGGVVS